MGAGAGETTGSIAASRQAEPPVLRLLCVLVAPEPVPGPRYRVLQFLPTFEAHGLACDVMTVLSTSTAVSSVTAGGHTPGRRLWHWSRTFAETQIGCLKALWRSRHYDRVLLYRVAVPAWAAWLLRRRRADLVYDFDDALDASGGDGWIGRLRHRILSRSLARAVTTCAVVSTSNARNAEVVTALGGRPVIVPTSVDLDRFLPHASPDSRVVLGWIGTPSTANYLPVIEDALADVLEARPQVTVRLIGSGSNPFVKLTAEVAAWDPATEARELARFDVGLMPMPDTPWTRGKAALKALQYGAAGSPTVASWTPTNEEILGASGAILCRTREEWRDALLTLIDDPARRASLGAQARAHVAQRYSVQANGPVLAAVIRCPLGSVA